MNITVTPPLGLDRPSRQSIQYRLVIAQQPVHARCCGFGDKDRRPIDPPVIVRLCVEGVDGKLVNVRSTENISHFVVQCDLYSADRKTNMNHVNNPALSQSMPPSQSASGLTSPATSMASVMTFSEPTPVRNLLGAIASSAYTLFDADQELGVFFIFQDLSVRTEGKFCLKFMFIDLSAGDPFRMSARVLDEVYSTPFEVYSAKTFPGMTGSTPLSLCFSDQGIKIPVRKGRRSKRPVPLDSAEADSQAKVDTGDDQEAREEEASQTRDPT